MKYEIVTTTQFIKDLKKLHKKYPSIKEDVLSVIDILETNPRLGTSLGNSCYKVRINITSKSSGKSGGARIINLVIDSSKTVKLISIYDKSTRSTITDSYLKHLIKLNRE